MTGRSSSSSGRSSSSSRSSYSSSRSSYSRPSYASRTSPAPTPAPTAVPAPSVSQQSIPQIQVQQPGFFSSMIQGFGLGAGQSIAHNIFRSNPTVTHIHETSGGSTTSTESPYSKEFIQCMKDNNDDKNICNQYIQCLKDNKDDKEFCKRFM
jgi:hypothetical protein